MALRFCDSFNHYATADATLKWNVTNVFSYSIVTGRNGNGLRIVGGLLANGFILKVIDNQATWIVGVAINLSASGASQGLISLWDNNTKQMGVYINGSAHLVIDKNGTALATSTGTWVNGWNYVEFKVTFNSTSGSATVKVNGASFVTYSGNVTQTANQFANTISLGDWLQNNGTSALILDDLYVCDATGTVNNDFLGDVVVEALYPNGAGSYSQFTPTGTASNFTAVNNTAPDGDTTYNVSNTLNTRDSFTFTDFSQGVIAVYGVQTILDMRKQGSGNRSLGAFFRASTTNYDQAGVAIGGTYAYYTSINETNPATSAAWTESEVNAIEAGYRITV